MLQLFLGSELVQRIRTTAMIGQDAQAQGPAIASGYDPDFPLTFVRLPNGKVFFADGINVMRKWNMQRYAAETVGVLPPTRRVDIAANLHPALDRNRIAQDILTQAQRNADYYSSRAARQWAFATSNPTVPYSSWRQASVDSTQARIWAAAAQNPTAAQKRADEVVRRREDLLRSGKSISSASFIAYLNTGNLQGQVADATNTITGRYTAYLRFVDYEGNVSNVSPISIEIDVLGATGFTYTNVQVPIEKKVKFRQILRNTAGQAGTYYVDLSTTDLVSSTLKSNNNDNQLLASEPVPFFDDAGIPLSMRHAVPPNDRPVIAYYKDRVWAAGEVTVARGHVQVTNGSTTVQGVGTHFTKEMRDRFLYITGARKPYSIFDVDEGAQTLTLYDYEPYAEGTDLFAVYTIQTPPADRANVYFSEPGLYESWNPFGGLSIDTQGEAITALVPADAFLYIGQNRRLWRITFKNQPYSDGAVFEALQRGCINQRAWVRTEGAVYCLDQQGIYRFDGGDEAKPVSLPVDDLFDTDHPKGKYRINWQGSKWFHAVHDRVNGVIRWFVCLSGSRPRHAIAHSLETQAVWLEEYPYPIMASTVWEREQPIPIAAVSLGKVMAMNSSTLDGPVWRAGTVRGEVTAATHTTLTDAHATYASTGVTGNPVLIVSGKGKGQWRLVASVSGTTLTVKNPWLVVPDNTSVYQLGGFNWQWKSKTFRWQAGDTDVARRLEMIFQPVKAPAEMDVQFYKDHRETPEDWGVSWPPTPADSTGVVYVKGEPEATVDLTLEKGFAQIRLSDNRDYHVEKGDFVSFTLTGGSTSQPITFHEMTIEGVLEQ